jgi:hypothetical protein
MWIVQVLKSRKTMWRTAWSCPHCYRLQHFVFVTLYFNRFRRILCASDTCILNCRTSFLVIFPDCGQWPFKLHSRQFHWLVVYQGFLLTDATSLNEQLLQPTNTLCREFLLHCDHRIQFMVSERTISSLHLRCHSTKLKCLRHLQFDPSNYLNNFFLLCHRYRDQYITLKSPTIHVHALYIKIHLMQNKMCYH